MTPLLELVSLGVDLHLPDGRALHAVRDVSLTVGERDRLGVVGESGCGKTTLMLTIMGLLPPNATVRGEIRWRGQNILRDGERSVQPHRWKDIAFVPQSAMNALNPVLTVASQFKEVLSFHDVPCPGGTKQKTAELLEMVGVSASRSRSYAHELSGGMRQRVAIALALACGPALLLADEPTTALDVIVQAEILELLKRLSDEIGLAIVLVTHDLPILPSLCNAAAVMYAGQAVEVGAVPDVLVSPSHPYTAALVAAIPDLYVAPASEGIPGRPPSLDVALKGCPFYGAMPVFDGALHRRAADDGAQAGAESPVLLAAVGDGRRERGACA